MSVSDLSIYVHFPYCTAKCPYCDFQSVPLESATVSPEEYAGLLARELKQIVKADPRLADRRLVSLYVGGGTPSLASRQFHSGLLAVIRDTFEIGEPFEWTIEVNPGTASVGDIDELVAQGLTRLSVGVQSFSDVILKTLGRNHTVSDSETLFDRLSSASANGLALGIDLIFGVPGQTIEQWVFDLERTVELGVQHCSVYGLTIHEGTHFEKWIKKGLLSLPDEEIQRKMYLEARNVLVRSDYNHYEISNFALIGFESVHNTRYWTGDDYLGLGVAAHSYVDGRRWTNPTNLADYRTILVDGRIPRVVEPDLGRREFLGEKVMLGLRRLSGIDLAEFESRWGENLLEHYPQEIERLMDAGFLELTSGKIRLTEEGLLVADAVMAEFF